VTATERAIELISIAATAAADKLATDIIAYDVSEQLVITDAFLLCSAANDRQVRAVVDEIEEKLARAGAKPVRRSYVLPFRVVASWTTRVVGGPL